MPGHLKTAKNKIEFALDLIYSYKVPSSPIKTFPQEIAMITVTPTFNLLANIIINKSCIYLRCI